MHETGSKKKWTIIERKASINNISLGIDTPAYNSNDENHTFDWRRESITNTSETTVIRNDNNYNNNFDNNKIVV